MVKKRKRKVVKECGKLFIDRLFDKTREELTTVCFQNERTANYELYKTQKLNYVCTLKPKRNYFLDDDKLINEGVKIYFRFNDLEKYNRFKELLWKYLSKSYYISPKLYPTSDKNGEIREGYILLSNPKEKDINKCLKEVTIEM